MNRSKTYQNKTAFASSKTMELLLKRRREEHALGPGTETTANPEDFSVEPENSLEWQETADENVVLLDSVKDEVVDPQVQEKLKREFEIYANHQLKLIDRGIDSLHDTRRRTPNKERKKEAFLKKRDKFLEKMEKSEDHSWGTYKYYHLLKRWFPDYTRVLENKAFEIKNTIYNSITDFNLKIIAVIETLENGLICETEGDISSALKLINVAKTYLNDGVQLKDNAIEKLTRFQNNNPDFLSKYDTVLNSYLEIIQNLEANISVFENDKSRFKTVVSELSQQQDCLTDFNNTIQNTFDVVELVHLQSSEFATLIESTEKIIRETNSLERGVKPLDAVSVRSRLDELASEIAPDEEEDLEDPEAEEMLTAYLKKHRIKNFYTDESTGLVAIQADFEDAFAFARKLVELGVTDERKWVWKGAYGSIHQVHGIGLAKRELKVVVADEKGTLVYDQVFSDINNTHQKLGELPVGKYSIYIKRVHRDNSKLDQEFQVTKSGVTYLDIKVGKNGYFTYTVKTEPPANSSALMGIGFYGISSEASKQELDRLYQYYKRHVSELGASEKKEESFHPSARYGTSGWGMYDDRATLDHNEEIRKRENSTGLLATPWSPGAGSVPFAADGITMLEKQLEPYEIFAAIRLINDLGIEKNYAVKDNIYSALLQKRIADKEKSYHEAFQKEVHKEASTISESIEMQEAFLEQERINTIFSIAPDFMEADDKITASYYKNEFNQLELVIPDDYNNKFTPEKSLKMLIKRWHNVKVIMTTSLKKIKGKEGYFFTEEQKDLIADFCLHLYFNLPGSKQTHYRSGDDELLVDNKYTSSMTFSLFQTMLWNKDPKKVAAAFVELENAFFQVIDREENNPFVLDPIDQAQDQIAKEKGIQKNYPNLKKLPGILMPTENVNEAIRKVAPELGKDVDIDTLSLPLYYNYEDGEYTVYLAHTGYIYDAYTYHGATMSEALDELAASGDLPEGKMQVKFKNQVISKQVERELSLADWLGIASLVLFAIAITIISAGASTSVFVPLFMGGSMLLGAASSLANMVENYQHNKLTTQNVIVDVTTIVASIIPALGTLINASARIVKASTMLSKISRFSRISGSTKSVLEAIKGTNYYRLTIYSGAASTVIDGAVLTAEVIEGIANIENSGLSDDKKNELLRQFMQQMIISGFFVAISARADIGDLKSFKNFRTIDKFEEKIKGIKTQSDYDDVLLSIKNSNDLDDTAKQIVKSFADEKYFRVKSLKVTGADPERVSQIKLRDQINQEVSMISNDIVEIESKLENSPNVFVTVDPLLTVIYASFQKYVRKKLNNQLDNNIVSITTKEGLIDYLKSNQTYYKFDPNNKIIQNDLEVILRESQMVGVTDDIQKKVRTYRELNPNTQYTNKELVDKFENGYEIGKSNSLFKPGKEVHHTAEISEDPEFTGGNVLDNKLIDNEHSEEVKALLQVRNDLDDQSLTLSMRKQLIEQKSGPIQKGSDLYEEIKAVKQLKVKNSEALAEAASDAYFVSKGYTKIFPAEGATSSISGEFDRIYKGPGDEILVIESKGGASALGSREIRNIPDRRYLGTRAEQGSTPYLIEIIFTMEKNGAAPQLTQELKNALESENLKYLKVQQSLDGNGDLKPLKINSFNLDQNVIKELITPK